jgi:type I site-specific restriction endonuclease
VKSINELFQKNFRTSLESWDTPPRSAGEPGSLAPGEAIAKGQDRILLVMATGTGKTYTALQIIWRLWKAGRKKRILFLADRNALIDQTMGNDFRPFGPAMAKLSTSSKTIERADGTESALTTAIDRKRRIDTAYETYLGLYQAITGPEDQQKLFREFSPGFFDLIVIDECHRGSAAEDAAWREILDYFTGATQIGMTATPKETKYVSNIHYFGAPVYSYSLKQGIQDGFLAPYKVVKVHLDRDVEGYRPEKGGVDREGLKSKTDSTTRKTSTARSRLMTVPNSWRRRSPTSSRRAATVSRRPSSSAWMATTSGLRLDARRGECFR